MINGDYQRILTVDLSSNQINVTNRTDLNPYLGGVGLATKLMSEEVQPGAAPGDQPVVLAIGPFAAIYPAATKAVAVFRSPLTGEWGESYAGMRLAMAMRFAGYDALVIRGRANHPVYLSVGPRGVEFRDARPLWGLSTEETGRLLRELEPGSGQRSCLRIGPAGERGVAFAGVNVDTFRHFGRLGLGAVCGAKLLKAVVIYGGSSYPIKDITAYRQEYEDIYRRVTATDIMEKYHGLGTAGNVLALNEMGALPTRNLQSGRFEAADGISGESFAQATLLRKMACAGCPLGCIHIGLLRRSFGPGYEYESATVAYDHELIFALGANLGLKSTSDVLTLIERVEAAGLDAISTGVALSWATEALNKGLLTEQDTLTQLAFGQLEPYLVALDNLLKQPNEFYQNFAQGTVAAARRYGGAEFALTMGKNEIAGYFTGYACLAGQAVGARHSHLDNAGYAIDQAGKVTDTQKVARKILDEELERCALNSLGICLFARKVYDGATVLKALAAIGQNWDEQRLQALGRQILTLKFALKRAWGFKWEELELPGRFFETPSPHGQLKKETLEAIIRDYRQELTDTLQLA